MTTMTKRLPKREWAAEVKRRQAAGLWVRGPETLELREGIEAAGGLWLTNGWLMPDEESRDAFIAIIAQMRNDDVELGKVVGVWHEAVFGKPMPITDSERETSEQLIGAYGVDVAGEVVRELIKVAKVKWPQCNQLVTACRLWLDIAVAERQKMLARRNEATRLAEQQARRRQEKERREKASKVWDALPPNLRAQIERDVMAKHPHIGDAVKRKSHGYRMLIESYCIESLMTE